MRMSGYVYNCSAGETWDMIALEIYGEETYAADVPERNQLVADTGNTAPWRR